MPRTERPWYDGIAATLRAVLSKQAAPDAAYDKAVSRLNQLD